MSLPKPVMRGLLVKRLKLHLPLAFVVSLGFAAAVKFGVTEPRKRAYAEFYKNYDATAEFNRMKEAGVFEGVKETDK